MGDFIQHVILYKPLHVLLQSEMTIYRLPKQESKMNDIISHSTLKSVLHIAVFCSCLVAAVSEDRFKVEQYQQISVSASQDIKKDFYLETESSYRETEIRDK